MYVTAQMAAPAPVAQFGAQPGPTLKIFSVVDRIDGLLRGKLAAQAGLASGTWKQIASAHPDIQDPFARLVNASSEVADASLVSLVDGFLKGLETAGADLGPASSSALGDLRNRFTTEFSDYYEPQDQYGRRCTVDAAGNWRSAGGPCRLTKVQGGGSALFKQMVSAGLGSADASVRAAVKRASQSATEALVAHPRRLYAKLNTASKVVLLLALAAPSAVAALQSLPIKYDKQTKTLSGSIPGLGPITVKEGKIKEIGLSLPPITARRATITASLTKNEAGKIATVDMVVPVKKAKLTAGTTVRQGPGAQSEGRLSFEAPLTKSSAMFLKAGVTVPLDTRGRRVEAASSPTVQASLSGKLPTLNRRLRDKAKATARATDAAAAADAAAARLQAETKAEIARLVRALQSRKTPDPDPAERDAMIQELNALRAELKSGSAVVQPPRHEYAADSLAPALALVAVFAFASHPR